MLVRGFFGWLINPLKPSLAWWELGMLERRERVIGLARTWGGPGPAVRPARPGRKKIGIEALLRWAYREELPRASAAPLVMGIGLPAASYGLVGIAEYLTPIDAGMGVNPFGVVAMPSERGPHQDAVTIAEAVAMLDGLDLELPEGWDPFEDMGEMGGHRSAAVADVLARLTVVDREGKTRLRSSPGRLVVKHAILGGAPDWIGGVPEVKVVRGEKGQPRWFVRRRITLLGGESYEVEADGFSSSARRPVAGAYQKTYLEPDPVPVGVERGEHEIWHAALDIMCDMLRIELEEWEVEPCARSARPWSDDAGSAREGRVLPDLCRPVEETVVRSSRRRKKPVDLRPIFCDSSAR
jgi:hypothetical protein